MEFYSNSRPDLIGGQMKKTVYKVMKKKSNNVTVSDKVSGMLSVFYQDYIGKNKFAILILLLCVAFLAYRYYNKEDKDESSEDLDKEPFNPILLNDFSGTNVDSQYTFDTKDIGYSGYIDKSLFNEVTKEQTQHLANANNMHDSQPSFNPTQSVASQYEPVNYPPEPIPMNIPGKGIVPVKNYFGDRPKPFPPTTKFDYDYDNVHDYPNLSYYSGTHNTYGGDQTKNQSSFVNPLGFSTQFNQTTGEFVNQMTDANQRNLYDYQTIIDSMNKGFTNSLTIGPNGLDDSAEPEMDPPYAL